MISEQLTSFVQNCETRNGSIFTLVAIESNGYGSPVGITGTVIIDGTVTKTYWNTDGGNKLHGYQYDLVVLTLVSEL